MNLSASIIYPRNTTREDVMGVGFLFGLALSTKDPDEPGAHMPKSGRSEYIRMTKEMLLNVPDFRG